jgi:hypothetical protein
MSPLIPNFHPKPELVKLTFLGEVWWEHFWQALVFWAFVAFHNFACVNVHSYSFFEVGACPTSGLLYWNFNNSFCSAHGVSPWISLQFLLGKF